MAEATLILETKDVVKRFGGLTAVNKMSFSMEAGRIYSIIGPNGAGKTTFFNALSGLYKPEEGTISFEGRRIDGLVPEKMTTLHMARTFQNIRLFGGMTVVENIMVGAYTRLKQGADPDRAPDEGLQGRGSPRRGPGRGADGVRRPQGRRQRARGAACPTARSAASRSRAPSPRSRGSSSSTSRPRA